MRVVHADNKTASADILASRTVRVFGVSLNFRGVATPKTPLLAEVRDTSGGDTGAILISRTRTIAASTDYFGQQHGMEIDFGANGVLAAGGLRLVIAQGTGTNNVAVDVTVRYEDA